MESCQWGGGVREGLRQPCSLDVPQGSLGKEEVQGLSLSSSPALCNGLGQGRLRRPERGGICKDRQVSELETTVKKILQMGKQRLERGSDLASVAPPGRGRSKPTATWRVGPAWHLCPPASHFEQVGKSVRGRDSLDFQVP